jgi:hypothetical protein
MKIAYRLNALVAPASAAVSSHASRRRGSAALPPTGVDTVHATSRPRGGAALSERWQAASDRARQRGPGAATVAGPVSIISLRALRGHVFAGTGHGERRICDVVVVRGLDQQHQCRIERHRVRAARVMIDRCAISGFSTGVGIALTTAGQTDLDVTDTLVRDSMFGVQLVTSGILSQVTLSNVRIESSPFGVDVSGSSVFLRLIDSTITNGNGDAIHINPLANRTVRFDVQRGAIIGNNVAVNAAPFNANVKVFGVINDVLVAENGSSGISAVAGGAGSIVNRSVTNSAIRYNGTGLRAQIVGATILSKNNLVTDNLFDISVVGAGAQMLTGLGNTLYNNGTPGAFTGTVFTQ